MTLVIVLLTALYLNGLVNAVTAAALERSEIAGQQANRFIVDRVNKSSGQLPAGGTVEQTKIAWRQFVSYDPEIADMLKQTMGRPGTGLVEINVAGEESDILASSNDERRSQHMQPLENFVAWSKLGFYRRVLDLFTRARYFQVAVPTGIPGQKDPLFTTQVVTSTVLLRAAVLDQLQPVGVIALAAMLSSLLITMLATSYMLRPIRRIEQIIDRITQGQSAGSQTDTPSTGDDTQAERERLREFAAVEIKLNMLGQQYSGARQDATNLKNNLDEMVERMASQLDVATRFAAISRVSSGVAHEIKNPLNAISLRLDLMKARMESGDDDLIPEIDILSSEVRRLDRVVKTFLDFTRPVELKLTDLDLTLLAREVSVLITPQAKVSGIEVEFQGPRVAPGLSSRAWMRGDPDLLKQAILNLVTNAIEAMKNGGRLKILMTQTARSVGVEISDTGPGIPTDKRDQVFQLYFTTKEKGSGIGLAMTYRTAQLHNGTVDFTSEVGRGTTFRLKFPARIRHE